MKVSYIMPGSVGTGFGASPEGIGADWKIWPEDVAEIVKMLAFDASENFSEPGGGSAFKTSATRVEEVNGANESAGSGEHLKKWY